MFFFNDVLVLARKMLGLRRSVSWLCHVCLLTRKEKF